MPQYAILLLVDGKGNGHRDQCYAADDQKRWTGERQHFGWQAHLVVIQSGFAFEKFAHAHRKDIENTGLDDEDPKSYKYEDTPVDKGVIDVRQQWKRFAPEQHRQQYKRLYNGNSDNYFSHYCTSIRS